MGRLLSDLQEYSTFWITFATQFTVSTVLNVIVAIFIYVKLSTNSEIETNMKFASNFIALVSAIVTTIGFVMNLYRIKYWNDEQSILYQEAGNIPLFMSLLMGYFLGDIIFRLYFIIRYKKKIIQRRWDLIAHHMFIGAVYPLINFPKPLYFHNLYGLAIGVEISSIFLSLQWFAKYYKSPKMHKVGKMLFFVSWFIVRVPACSLSLIWFIKHWNYIMDEELFRGSIMFTLNILNISMNLAWTVTIIKKIYFAIVSDELQSKDHHHHHAHAVSLELNEVESSALIDDNITDLYDN